MKAVFTLVVLCAASGSAYATCSGTTVDVTACGGVGGAKSAILSTTNGSGAVVGPTGTFISGDVGKIFWCIDKGAGTPVIALTTIASFTDSAHVTATAHANQTLGGSWCVWATQKDTSAFQSANAAVTSAEQVGIESGQFLGPSGTVTFCGGYAIDGWAYKHSTNGPAPHFEGCGKNSAVLYLTPDVDLATSPTVLVVGTGADIGGFTVSAMGLVTATFTDVIRFNQAGDWVLHDVGIRDVGSQSQVPVLNVLNSLGGHASNVTVQNGSVGTAQIGCMFNGDGNILVENILCSNFGLNLVVENNPGARSPGGANVTFVGGIIDECFNGETATTGCTVLQNQGYANFIGTTFYSPGAGSFVPAISVDGTSRLWISDANAGQFQAVADAGALYVASGGVVTSFSTTWRGNGTSPAINNQGMFIDGGGNDYLNCQNTTCTQIGQDAAFAGSATGPFADHQKFRGIGVYGHP